MDSKIYINLPPAMSATAKRPAHKPSAHKEMASWMNKHKITMSWEESAMRASMMKHAVSFVKTIVPAIKRVAKQLYHTPCLSLT